MVHDVWQCWWGAMSCNVTRSNTWRFVNNEAETAKLIACKKATWGDHIEHICTIYIGSLAFEAWPMIQQNPSCTCTMHNLTDHMAVHSGTCMVIYGCQGSFDTPNYRINPQLTNLQIFYKLSIKSL